MYSGTGRSNLRVTLGILLILLGVVAWLPPVQIFGGDETRFMRTLLEDPGVVVETYPNGVHKITEMRVKVGDREFERRTYFEPQPNVKRREVKTPTREFHEVWDTGKGWIPERIVRDDRSLAGRWGWPQVAWPYFAAALVLVAAGIVVLRGGLRGTDASAP